MTNRNSIFRAHPLHTSPSLGPQKIEYKEKLLEIHHPLTVERRTPPYIPVAENLGGRGA